MKKTILTIAGSALIALSTVQLAAASVHHRGKLHRTHTEFRDSNAYATPTYGAAQVETYRYSGGYSDMAGH